MSADIETVSVAYDIMRALGAENKHFQIRVNDRRIINFLLGDCLKESDEHIHQLSKLIDRKAKMPEENFVKQAQEMLGEKASVFINFLNNTDINNLPEEFTKNEGWLALKKLLESLKEANITNIIYDPTIIRGFDYYTGMVFEIFDTGPKNNRSLFGGGRYDDLSMIGRNHLADLLRVWKLRIFLFAKPDREGLDAGTDYSMHQSGNKARVYPSAEKQPKRNVAHQSLLDRV